MQKANVGNKRQGGAEATIALWLGDNFDLSPANSLAGARSLMKALGSLGLLSEKPASP